MRKKIKRTTSVVTLPPMEVTLRKWYLSYFRLCLQVLITEKLILFSPHDFFSFSVS